MAEIKNLGLVLAGETVCPCGRESCDGTCAEKYLVLPEYCLGREDLFEDYTGPNPSETEEEYRAYRARYWR